MAHTADRFRAIAAEHGPGAVSAYIGNPTAFNALATLHMAPLLRALGVRRTFSSGTQDCANKFVASEAVFGTSTVHPIPDLEHTDLCLVIGENPRASQGSFYSIPNVLGELRRATARGARIVFVNPRRIETPERGIGDTVLIRPDTDVWFLAALLHEIDARGGFDAAVVARHGTRVDELRAFLAEYPADRVAAVTGIDADVVRELAAAWVATPRASVHASTGINMGRQGSLAYWLVHMLSFVTGRLDVEGGNLKSDGFYANAKSGAGVPEQGYVDTEFGRLRRGALPGTLMADAILDSADAGAGDGRHRRQPAAVDRRPGAPAQGVRAARAARRHRHLPQRHRRARPRRAAVHRHVRARRPQHRQHRHERRDRSRSTRRPSWPRRTNASPEWWIAHRLLQELGEVSILDDESPDPWSKWRHMLQRGAGVELAELQASGDPVVLPAPAPGEFFAKQVWTEDGRVDCCPPSFAPRHRALPRPVRRGRRRHRPAAPDPRPRPVDAQHVVRQPAAR